jgi:hypothetical protein
MALRRELDEDSAGNRARHVSFPLHRLHRQSLKPA